MEAERQDLLPYLQTLFRAVQKLNVVHIGLYFQSQYKEIVHATSKDRRGEEPRPKFNCAAYGLWDSQTSKYLQFDFPMAARPDEQLDLDRWRRFRLDDEWFIFSLKDQQ